MYTDTLDRAVDVLMSPLNWGSQDAWIAESLKRVRQVYGVPDSSPAVVPTAELEELLRFEDDEPGWLDEALDTAGAGYRRPGLPRRVGEGHVARASMRCALAAGVAMLHKLHTWRNTLGQVCDDMNAGMAIFNESGLAETARNGRWSELLEEEPSRDRLLEVISHP